MKNYNNELYKKENAIILFNEMIENSWTYGKMTQEEKEKWHDILKHVEITKDLQGNYLQRWKSLNLIYHSYLIGIGYTDFNWREQDPAQVPMF